MNTTEAERIFMVVLRYFGLAALIVGLIVATASYFQPALDKVAFAQRAQDAAAHGQQVYVEFNSPDQPAQKQADRLDGMIYGFGVSLVGVLLFASVSRLHMVGIQRPDQQIS